MRNMMRLILLLVATALTFPVIAGTWTQEPTAVFGIQIGQPVPATVPVCPPRSAPEPAQLCAYRYVPNSTLLRGFRGLPDLGFPYSVRAQMIGDKVGVLFVETDHANYGRLRAILVERYGAPESTESSAVQNGMGATFQSEKMKWLGAKVEMKLFERFTDINSSEWLIGDLELLKAQAQEEDTGTRRAASKL